MPFDFMKKKSGDKGEAKAEAPKSIKKQAKAQGFADGEESLKPEKETNGAKSGGMPSLRHALKVGKKDTTPAERRAVAHALGGLDTSMGYTVNLERRGAEYKQNASKDPNANPELLVKLSSMVSLCKKYQSAGERLLAAYADYEKRGFMTPLKAAIQEVTKVGMELRVLMSGLRGPGDSVADGSLLSNVLRCDVVNGVQGGAKDKEAGKVPDAPAKGHNTEGASLPLSGDGYALMAQALRNYSEMFMESFDLFATRTAAL